jgi:phospholipid transport system transporter-binding protein
LSVAGFVIERVAPDRLRARGELGFATASLALRSGMEQIGRADDQVVDLAGVTEGDSAGVAVLVEWISVAAAAGVGLRYENVPPQMLAIARISDLEDLLLRA